MRPASGPLVRPSSATASAAVRIAPRIAGSGSTPCSSAVSSASLAVSAAVCDASSGREAEETPSQTTATCAFSPPGSEVAATAKASSLRWWRTPRSLTAATPDSSRSWWSRGRGWAAPQDSQ